MSALSSQQINQSYQGLIKLADSTTGITTNPQQIQDGLGNNIGIKIATNRLEGGNLFNIYRPAGIPQYFGNGISSSGINPGASQNQMVATTFYDNGEYSYSAITMSCQTLEAGSSVDVSFYNTQMLDTYGYVPYQKMVGEVNVNTTSTGFKTITFGSPLSFSATGPGVYYCVVRYNTASTPVLRLGGVGANNGTYLNWLLSSVFGLQYNSNSTLPYNPFRAGNVVTSTAVGQIYNTASFPSTFTSTELNTLNTGLAATAVGFLLHTIR